MTRFDRIRLACAKFVRDTSGHDTVEYALVTGLIVLGLIATFGIVGDSISGFFVTATSQMDNNM